MQKRAPGRPSLFFARALSSLLLCTVSGCVASSYAVQSGKAARAVEHARRAHAGDQAPYELTLAEAYLDKAREESSHAAYQDANRLARKSQENAAKAVAKAREQPSEVNRLPASGGR